MISDLQDHRVRMAAFEWLERQVRVHGDVLPFQTLSRHFFFEGQRVPLLGPRGIFKPKVMDLPLSITTAPDGPYEDAFSQDGLLQYKYRGTDPFHRDNVGLRECMRRKLPLVYLHGLVKGRYLVAWPVYIVGDDPRSLSFAVAVDDELLQGVRSDGSDVGEGTEIRRKYVTSTVRRRLHQRAFRERVLAAYRQQCALCRLKHEALLEAAHIVPDAEPGGEPIVRNGVSLCKLHHAAFDRNIMGIRPDHVVQIRIDVLEEIDGPMLKHGLQEMHGRKIYVPRKDELKPDPRALEMRWERFRSTA